MPAKAPKSSDGSYARKKSRETARAAAESRQAREIGPLPAVVNPRRKKACRLDLRRFAEAYFAGRFPLAWGDDHLALIADLQRVILEGGRQAEAHPRGSGKTTICEVAAIWALLYGHRSFVVLIGATETKAEELLDDIKAEIESNDELADDFPESCYPIRKLEGINNRCAGQLLDNRRTRIQWTAKAVTFPTVKKKPSSGAIAIAVGLTGSIRGLARLVDSRKLRPDLAIIDDPQTDESARSPVQNLYRESVIAGAILGLAGPGKKIAAVMPCTPIRPGDMADRILDRARHPEWHGRRCRLLRSMPARLDLWERYAELLRDGLREDPPSRVAANGFYRDNREAMDAEADPSWPARFDPDQLSAVQYAMDLYILDPRTFAAEYQCEPQADAADTGGAEPIDPEIVSAKLNRVPRGEIPVECTRLTCGVDVQQEILFWLVAAWDERFGGAVVDYGAWPAQHDARFTGTNPSPSLYSLYPGLPLEARLFRGLEQLAANVLGREYPRSGGGPSARVERCLVDSGNWTDTIHQWCRQTAHAATVTASKGVYVGAAKTPFSEWRPLPGERHGTGWRLKAAPSARGRLLLFDANYWKSFLRERLHTAPSAPGCLYLPGSEPSAHALLCDHLVAEHPVRTSANGRSVDEWQSNPGRPDNHWLDCLVMAAAAAASGGLTFHAGGAPAAGTSEKPVKLSDIQRQKRAQRATR